MPPEGSLRHSERKSESIDILIQLEMLGGNLSIMTVRQGVHNPSCSFGKQAHHIRKVWIKGHVFKPSCSHGIAHYTITLF